MTKLDSIFNEEQFDTAVIYPKPCLLYNNKSLLTIGGNLKDLDTGLSFRYDPNGKYSAKSDIATDYLCVDKYFSANLSTGTLSGIVFFSTDKTGKIFALNANWSFMGDMVDTAGMEI